LRGGGRAEAERLNPLPYIPSHPNLGRGIFWSDVCDMVVSFC
jgi:hypothetical protein